MDKNLEPHVNTSVSASKVNLLFSIWLVDVGNIVLLHRFGGAADRHTDKLTFCTCRLLLII
jgi:hypothetical protein